MHFIKMEGAGNDYVYVDATREDVPGDLAALARRMSDRHYGVGGDGLIVIAHSEKATARMAMFNNGCIRTDPREMTLARGSPAVGPARSGAL